MNGTSSGELATKSGSGLAVREHTGSVTGMSWLVCDGAVLASLEVAETHRARRRGLLGRDGIDGALLLRSTRSVHTLGMRFAIDVAWCDDELVVIRVATVPRHRIPRPVWRARAVVEAEAGSFERWGLGVGDQLDVAT